MPLPESEQGRQRPLAGLAEAVYLAGLRQKENPRQSSDCTGADVGCLLDKWSSFLGCQLIEYLRYILFIDAFAGY